MEAKPNFCFEEYFVLVCSRYARVAQLVEHLPSKQDVASSSLVSRSNFLRKQKIALSLSKGACRRELVEGPFPLLLFQKSNGAVSIAAFLKKLRQKIFNSFYYRL